MNFKSDDRIMSFQQFFKKSAESNSEVLRFALREQHSPNWCQCTVGCWCWPKSRLQSNWHQQQTAYRSAEGSSDRLRSFRKIYTMYTSEMNYMTTMICDKER